MLSVPIAGRKTCEVLSQRAGAVQAKGNAVDLASQQLDDESEGDENESDGEDIFKPRARDDDADAGSYDGIDALDCSRLLHDANTLAAWDEPEAQQSLRNRFVTGEAPVHYHGTSPE